MTQRLNIPFDILSDIDYLAHMIPHHQVAIDMSNMLIPNTKNPHMLHLCRDIIRKQGYEIWEMNQMKKNLSDTIFADLPHNVETFKTKMDIHAPILSKSKDGNCNPLFFKPNDHKQHMVGMDVTDKSYLEHMIPHHQVAIDMSRRLLLHTTDYHSSSNIRINYIYCSHSTSQFKSCKCSLNSLLFISLT